MTTSLTNSGSNLTMMALTKNKEWNTKIVATSEGEYTHSIVNEFYEMWEQSKKIDEWIDTYSRIYEEKKRVTRTTKIATMSQIKLVPNTMQISFIQNLKNIIETGAKRALLISSTG